MKRKLFAMAVLAAFLLSPYFNLAAYANGGPEEINIIEEIIIRERNPFTPSGTGTVVDHADGDDEKVFYTITTADEHIFYLVIDRQRGTENVYFLNAVTVADLMALAEKPDETVMEPEPPIIHIPMPVLDETHEGQEAPADPGAGENNNIGTYLVIGLFALLGIAAGWYFKIHKPKQAGVETGDEYEETDDGEDYAGDWDDEPWDEESEEAG